MARGKSIFDFGREGLGGFEPKPPKKRNLTNAQKIWCWENKSHKCYICLKRISKLSEAEFDHKRAYVKGGATNLGNVKLAHRLCNRLKGSKSLSQIQKELGIKGGKKGDEKKPPEGGRLITLGELLKQKNL